MDFNPLDLLASAAELQKKNDDTENEVTMVTRQRNNSSSTTKTFTAVVQKENKELKSVNNNKNINNNNNVNIKGKSVIIRKIKVGANTDLEKMLNEHNYGNAKKNFETIKVVFEDSGRNRTEAEDISEGTHETSPDKKGVHPLGKNGDKITIITVASKDSGSLTGDVECTSSGDLNRSNVDTSTCSSTVTSGCSLDSTSASVQSSKCLHLDSECPGASTDDEQVSCENVLPGDKTRGHVEGHTDGQSVISNDSLNNVCDSKKEDTLPSSVEKSVCEINGNNSNKNSECLAEQPNSSEINLDLIENENECVKSSVETSLNTEESPSVSIDSLSKRPAVTNTSNVFVRDRKSTELNHKVSTSEFKKAPYVNVSVKQTTQQSVTETQPLVISINGKTNDTKVTEKEPLSGHCDNIEQSEKKSNSRLEIIRSLLTSEKQSEESDYLDGTESVVTEMVSSKPMKLDISKCGSLDLGETSESYSTLKSLELNDSLCGENSTRSVHLLSPDRRNPDSVGIVESPVTNIQDSGSVQESDKQTVKFDFFNDSLSIQEKHNDSIINKEIDQKFETRLEKSSVKTDSIGNNSDIIMKDSLLLLPGHEKSDNKSANDFPIFRYEYDHSYAGLPGKINSSEMLREQDALSQSEEMEVGTPLGSSGGDLSQDSGYEDITQSPVSESVPCSSTSDVNVTDSVVSSQNLVPVLVSINDNGSLTLHNDPRLQKTVTGQLFSVQDNGAASSLDSGVKLFSGTNLTPLSPAPLLLSPVGQNSPIKTNTTLQHVGDGIMGLLRPTTPDMNSSLVPVKTSQQSSPPKFGKFRIGTFASFSNTGMQIDEPPRLLINKPTVQEKISRSSSGSQGKRHNSAHGVNSGKSSPVVDTLGTLVQKVRSSLSPSSQIDAKNFTLDHIHHDHDYCMKNLMPSVVSSVLEAKLQKELTKSKQNVSKSKKMESDQMGKGDFKFGKRKRSSSNAGRDEVTFEGVLFDDNDSNSQSDFTRPKTRAEKYIEQKSSEPKVKITGSSNFQDQFVYFMNTKKRSRRRESRDSPIPVPLDKLFIPPKPGDIIVPHLTDQDIENLKQRSKQRPGHSRHNSLRNEFMASKLANIPFSGQAQLESVDDEKNIINTILSLENENLTDHPQEQADEPYNESMEMYGQGLGGDIMNFIPERMNLTQEQMDLLFSAVDEVQNSSPDLIGGDKLVAIDGGETTFGNFPVIESNLQVTPTDKPGDEGKVGEDTTCDTKQTGVVAETAKGLTSIDSEDKEPFSTVITNGCKVFQSTEDDRTIQTTDVEVTPVPEADTKASNIESIQESAAISEELKVPSNSCEDKVDLSVNQQIQLTNDVPTIDTSVALPMVGTPTPSYSRPDFSESGLVEQSTSVSGMILSASLSNSSSEQSVSSVGNMNLPSNLPTSSGNLNTDIPLQTLERGPLDLLTNELRLDKSDLFADGSVSTPSSLASSNLSTPVQVPSDYSAPWIVTVSMYWNDLPAVMINNQPFVRLVDIHKQILPAKDTGILKKRCQLMGIRVENCSEMQRYFLVQYGKAFNSKSTLIVSKESANELIGYYVDPQPKTSRMEEHTGKSVIEHRREQLRRIALARRAEIRARQNAERKEEDPRAIKEPTTSQGLEPLPVADQTKVEVEVPKVMSVVRPGASIPVHGTSTGLSVQRSTRHKKINFLEMLRGDTTSGVGDSDNLTEETPQVRKQTQKLDVGDVAVKKSKKSQEKKIKIVKYSVQPKVPLESSETETDYSSNGEEMETDSTSGSEIYVVKKTYKPRKLVQSEVRYKPKSKLKLPSVKKPAPRLPLKVRISTKRPSKSAGTVTPMSMNRSVGTLAAPFSQTRRDRSLSPQTESHSTQDLLGHRVMSASVVNWNGSTSSDENKTLDSILKFDRNVNDYEKVKVLPNYSEDLHVTNFGDFGSRSLIKEFTEADLKVSQSLPSEILDTSGMNENETNTDINISESEEADKFISNSEESRKNESVDNSVNIECENKVMDNVNPEPPLSDTDSRSQSPLMNVKRSEPLSVTGREVGLQIIHRDSSPQSEGRSRAQLGELFIEKYSNKKSLCIRCYTCRKMMSVDTFLRHLHDVSGGFILVEGPRTIDIGESDIDEQGLKLWESFQRKKELFDNNQVPSPDVFAERVLYNADMDSTNHSNSQIDSNSESTGKPVGPLVITTPVSSVKTFQAARQITTMVSSRQITPHASRQITTVASSRKVIPHNVNESIEGTRSSSRKRKKKQLYPCEEYSFSKFPRLQGGCKQTESID